MKVNDIVNIKLFISDILLFYRVNPRRPDGCTTPRPRLVHKEHRLHETNGGSSCCLER